MKKRKVVIYAVLVALYAFAFIRVAPVVAVAAVAVAVAWPLLHSRIACRRHVVLAAFAAGAAALVYAAVVGAGSDEIVALPYMLFGLFGLLALYDAMR